jgi:hypothetical protein
MARSATSAGEEEGIAKVETSKVAKQVVVMGEFSGPPGQVPAAAPARAAADFMAT